MVTCAATASSVTGMERVFRYVFGDIYRLYVDKVERKGRTEAELRTALGWLTGFDDAELDRQIAQRSTLEGFFAEARVTPDASLITGVVCGVRVEDIEDPLMQRIRWMDKIVDELAKGKKLEKVLRA